ASKSPVKSRAEIDRWMMSELHLLVRDVTRDLDGYDVYTATVRITQFVDALSNWYVRRSRDRFWRAASSPGLTSDKDADKRAAYETLWECLVVLARVMAPFTPYMADAIYRNLVVSGGLEDEPDSVHLTRWPEADESLISAELSATIKCVRELVSLGLQV